MVAKITEKLGIHLAVKPYLTWIAIQFLSAPLPENTFWQSDWTPAAVKMEIQSHPGFDYFTKFLQVQRKYENSFLDT